MSDLVPPLTDRHCQVWWATPAMAGPRLWPLLHEHERESARALRRPADRARYLVAHALTRWVVGAHALIAPAAVRFSYVCRRCGAAHGEPVPDGAARGLELSLSHAGRRSRRRRRGSWRRDRRRCRTRHPRRVRGLAA